MLGWSRCEANIRDCSPRLLILSLDTATDIATACVWRDGDALAESATRARSVAAQRVLADVDRLMDEAGVVPADLDMVVAGTGPGTFTGLRIGLAAARALGFALGIPVKGVSTLDALLAGEGVEVACVDARRGEVFAAADLGAGAGEPVVCAPDRLREALGGDVQGALAGGDGAVRFRTEIEAIGFEVPADEDPANRLAAGQICALAAKMEPGGGQFPAGVIPKYMRRPDAERWLERNDGN